MYSVDRVIQSGSEPLVDDFILMEVPVTLLDDFILMEVPVTLLDDFILMEVPVTLLDDYPHGSPCDPVG